MSERPPVSARSHNVGYVEGLDHLRGIAAFLVLLHHGYFVALVWEQPARWTAEAWPHLDNALEAMLREVHFVIGIFFVVSGFIFTLASYRRGLSYSKYMRNRALRVLPVFFTALLFGLAVFPDRFNLAGLISTATVFAGMPGAIDLHPVSTAFWTVGVEMQFYIAFPFLIAIMNRQGVRPFVFLIALMTALRGIGFVLVDQTPANDIANLNYWFLVPGRLDQFIIGMLGARIYMRWKEDPRVPRLGPTAPGVETFVGLLRNHSLPVFAIATGALMTWAWSMHQLGGFPAHHPWKIIHPTAEAVLCLLFVLSYLAFVPSIPRLGKRVMSFLGDMSFSTYMCHFMVVGIVIGNPLRRQLMPTHMVDFSQVLPFLGERGDALANTLLLVVPISIGLSVLFFNGIEAPFMRLRRRYVRDLDETE